MKKRSDFRFGILDRILRNWAQRGFLSAKVVFISGTVSTVGSGHQNNLVFGKALEHQHAVATATYERMAGIGQHTPFSVLYHIVEIVEPVLQHALGRHQALETVPLGLHELEMRVIIETPAYRHFDEWGFGAEEHRLIDRDDVARAGVIGRTIMPHHAALIDKAVLK